MLQQGLHLSRVREFTEELGEKLGFVKYDYLHILGKLAKSDPPIEVKQALDEMCRQFTLALNSNLNILAQILAWIDAQKSNYEKSSSGIPKEPAQKSNDTTTSSG